MTQYVKGVVVFQGNRIMYATQVRNNETQQAAVLRLFRDAIRHYINTHNNLGGRRPSFQEVRGLFAAVAGAILV